jgi:hypothetical protein
MDLKSIKNKLNALQTQGQKKEKVDYSKYLWKPKQEGKYQIRIVPSKLDKNNPFREVFVHYGFSKFPIYALTNWGEKDPIVEFAKQLKQTNDKENWKLAKKLEPKMRVFAPVIVRGEEDKGVRMWEFGKEIYMQLLGIADDEDYGDYTDISEGRDFTLEAVMGDIGGRQGLKTSIRIKPKTSPLGTDKSDVESWLENQPDILELQRKTEFAKLKEILQNWLNPEDASDDVDTDDEEETEEVTPKAKGDLPWEDEDEEDEAPVKSAPVKSNYELKTKKSKADKFDELFEDED